MNIPNIELLAGKVPEKSKSSSFLSLAEKDDDSSDDGDEPRNGPTNNIDDDVVHEYKHSDDEKQFGFLTDNSDHSSESNSFSTGDDFSFLQKEKKKKSITDIVYSKPILYKGDNLSRIGVFRQAKMNELQSNHHWKPSLDEGMNGNFRAEDKKNSDHFISFLGFLRDSSRKASKNINELELKKYFSDSK